MGKIRDEIAGRTLRAYMGPASTTVALSPVADRPLHVGKADRAHCVGPAPSRKSYLHMLETILSVNAGSASPLAFPDAAAVKGAAAVGQHRAPKARPATMADH